jgi:hypothetical protein
MSEYTKFSNTFDHGNGEFLITGYAHPSGLCIVKSDRGSGWQVAHTDTGRRLASVPTLAVGKSALAAVVGRSAGYDWSAIVSDNYQTIDTAPESRLAKNALYAIQNTLRNYGYSTDVQRKALDAL